jgi:plastocyanin
MRARIAGIAVVIGIAAATVPFGAAAKAGGGCLHGTRASVARGDTVEIRDVCFTQAVLYVDRGTDVTWVNHDPMEHNIVGVGGTWGDLETNLQPGDRVSYAFDQDGVYPYACWIHPGMVGAIVVGDGVGKSLGGVSSVASTGGTDGGSAAGAAGRATPAPASSGGVPVWLFVAVVGGFVIIALAAVIVGRRRSIPGLARIRA